MPLTTEQRKALENAAREWRQVASRVGPMHALWDSIFDAECLLAGKPSILTFDELLPQFNTDK